MKRKNCKQTKDSDPNWGEKMELPETTRTETGGVICFMDGREKLVGRYSDSRLECDKKIVSYSCTME